MPIELDVPQNTRAWLEARLGIGTASECSRIITPPAYRVSDIVHARAVGVFSAGRISRNPGAAMCSPSPQAWDSEPIASGEISCEKCLDTIRRYVVPADAFELARKAPIASGCALSSGRAAYLGELLAEWVLGEPYADFESDLMVRGSMLEAESFAFYSFRRDIQPRKIGLVYRDESREFACSPDALVGDDGGLELKCPRAPTHLAWLSAGGLPGKHTAQVQACIWVTGRAWWDFMSYHPGLPELLIRVEPDPAYQAALDEHIPAFIAENIANRAAIKRLGVRRWNED